MGRQRKSQLRSGSGRSFCHGPGQQSLIHPRQCHSAVTGSSSTQWRPLSFRLQMQQNRCKLNKTHA